MNEAPLIAIVGPTASGKTGLAVRIAQLCEGEIISADSRLVYKGFDIASAKPTMEERQGIEHYLIDIVEPEIDYSEQVLHLDKNGNIIPSQAQREAEEAAERENGTKEDAAK